MRNLKRLLLGTTRDIVMIGEDPPILTVANMFILFLSIETTSLWHDLADAPELAHQLPFLAASLSFGRTVSNATRAALRLFLQDPPPQTTPNPESDTDSDLDLTELFTVGVANTRP